MSDTLDRILKNLPSFFNANNDTLLYSVLSALAQQIETVNDTALESVDSLILQNATTDFLDYWGEWYGIPRTLNEQDLQYALRILAEITLPKQTVPAIIYYLSKVLNIDSSHFSIYEPYTDLIKLSETGTLSGFAKLTDSDYWNWTVIDIQTDQPITDYMRDIVNHIKAGGIKVFWTHFLYSTPPILDLTTNLSSSLFYEYTVSNLYPFYNQTLLLDETGELSGTGTISGYQIVWAYFERILEQLNTAQLTFTVLSAWQYYTTVGYGTQAYGTTWYGARQPI